MPARLPIAELMPSVVDLIGCSDLTGKDVGLARVGGEVLDPASALAHHMIRDGELLLLSAAPTRPTGMPRFDTGAAIVDVVAGMAYPRKGASRRRIGRIVVCWCAAMMLVLMYPGQSGLSGFLLIMSAISATSLVAWRLLDCARLVFLPLAAVTMTAAAMTVGAVFGWWPATAVGPLLVVAALGTLTVSARLSVRGSRLAAVGLSDSELEARTRAAHHRLTLLIVTAAAAAALGTAIAAATALRPAITASFIAVVGATLSLQARHRDDLYRVGALVISSGVSATALIGLCALKIPASTTWLCAGLVVVGVCAAWLPWRLSAGARRVIAALDLMVSAAVVPAAVGAAGMFEALL